MSIDAHWDNVWTARSSEEMGWFEAESSTLGLVIAHSSGRDSVIDVGGGDSRLVDALLDRGHHDLTVLDLSDVALERAKQRLGDRAEGVAWIHADVTAFAPTRTWDLWHDRALFHFLVDDGDRAAYHAVAAQAVAPGGRLVVATFSMDGPDHCAGLPVRRYDPESLPASFAPAFEVITVGLLTAGSGPHDDRRAYVAAVLART